MSRTIIFFLASFEYEKCWIIFVGKKIHFSTVFFPCTILETMFSLCASFLALRCSFWSWASLEFSLSHSGMRLRTALCTMGHKRMSKWMSQFNWMSKFYWYKNSSHPWGLFAKKNISVLKVTFLSNLSQVGGNSKLTALS